MSAKGQLSPQQDQPFASSNEEYRSTFENLIRTFRTVENSRIDKSFENFWLDPSLYSSYPSALFDKMGVLNKSSVLSFPRNIDRFDEAVASIRSSLIYDAPLAQKTIGNSPFLRERPELNILDLDLDFVLVPLIDSTVNLSSPKLSQYVEDQNVTFERAEIQLVSLVASMDVLVDASSRYRRLVGELLRVRQERANSLNGSKYDRRSYASLVDEEKRLSFNVRANRDLIQRLIDQLRTSYQKQLINREKIVTALTNQLAGVLYNDPKVVGTRETIQPFMKDTKIYFPRLSIAVEALRSAYLAFRKILIENDLLDNLLDDMYETTRTNYDPKNPSSNNPIIRLYTRDPEL